MTCQQRSCRRRDANAALAETLVERDGRACEEPQRDDECLLHRRPTPRIAEVHRGRASRARASQSQSSWSARPRRASLVTTSLPGASRYPARRRRSARALQLREQPELTELRKPHRRPREERWVGITATPAAPARMQAPHWRVVPPIATTGTETRGRLSQLGVPSGGSASSPTARPDGSSQ